MRVDRRQKGSHFRGPKCATLFATFFRHKFPSLCGQGICGERRFCLVLDAGTRESAKVAPFENAADIMRGRIRGDACQPMHSNVVARCRRKGIALSLPTGGHDITQSHDVNTRQYGSDCNHSVIWVDSGFWGAFASCGRTVRADENRSRKMVAGWGILCVGSLSWPFPSLRSAASSPRFARTRPAESGRGLLCPLKPGG